MILSEHHRQTASRAIPDGGLVGGGFLSPMMDDGYNVGIRVTRKDDFPRRGHKVEPWDLRQFTRLAPYPARQLYYIGIGPLGRSSFEKPPFPCGFSALI